MADEVDPFTVDSAGDPSPMQDVSEEIPDGMSASQQSTVPDCGNDTPPPSGANPATPQKRKTRASSSPSSAEKGKAKASSTPAPPPAITGQSVPRTPIQRLESVSATRAKSFWEAARRDLERVQDNADRDRESTNSRLDLLSAAVVALTDTTTTLSQTTADLRTHLSTASEPRGAEWQELYDRVSIIARTQEENEELQGREVNGINQRHEATQDEVRAIARNIEAMSSAVAALTAHHAALAPTAPPPLATTHQPGVPGIAQAPQVAAPPPAPANPATPVAATPTGLPATPVTQYVPPPNHFAPPPHIPHDSWRPRTGYSNGSRPNKRRAMDPPAPAPLAGPTAYAMPTFAPVAGPAPPIQQPNALQPAPVPMPLPGLPNDHPAIARFGRVRWAVQPAILRQQVYTCARAAWDAYPGLFPSITDITLQSDDHEFAEITFPSASLARSFVDAWQRYRASAGEWRRLQAHLV